MEQEILSPNYAPKVAEKKSESKLMSRHATINKLVNDGKYVMGISESNDIVKSPLKPDTTD